MKILEVIPVFSSPFGGPVTVVRSISKELAKRHEVDVYTTTALDPKHDFAPHNEELNGYKVSYFERSFKQLCYTGIFGHLNLSLGLMQAVKRNLQEFDVVHVHSWQQFPDVLVHHFAAEYGVPYVLQVHGSLPDINTKQFLKKGFSAFFGNRLLNDASRVIALNQVEAEQYRRAGVPAEKVAVIPNGLDPSEFIDLPPKGSFRKKMGLNENEQIVLFLGRIHKIKGIDILVKAFAAIAEEVRNIKLVIAGPDDGYLDTLVTQIADLKIANKVLIVGPLYGRNKIEAYVDATVFVLPSRYEMFPMSVLEAVACKTPVIVTENCGIANFLRNKAGLVVKLDFGQLRDAIKWMLDEDHAFFFRENSGIITAQFNIVGAVGKLEKIFEEIIETR